MVAGAQAQTITYQVDRSFGAGTIVGTIETDGISGPLSPGNIVSWSFEAFDGTDVVSISSATGGFLLGTAWKYLTATSSELSFDFDGALADPDPSVEFIAFIGEDSQVPSTFGYNLLGNFVGKVEQLVHQFGVPPNNGEHRVDSPTRSGQVVIASVAGTAANCGAPVVSLGEVISGLQAGLTGGFHTETGEPESFAGAVNFEERRGFIIPENGISSVQCDNDHILIGEWFATPLDRFDTILEAKEWVTSLFGGLFVEYYLEVDGNRVDHIQTGTKIGFLPWGRQVAFFNAGYVIEPYSISPGPHTATFVLVRDADRNGEPPFVVIRLTADFTIVDSAAGAP